MIKRFSFSIILFCICCHSYSQDAKAIVRQCNAIFANIKDYSCAINLVFDIPGLHIGTINGKVFFKKPNRFRIRTKGIVFLPKQNPNQLPMILADTLSFIPIFIGKETSGNQPVNVIQMVPLKDNDVVAAKFYINDKGQILKAQISTKENGTSDIANEFDDNISTKMPSKTTISFDMKKFKVPKMVAVDINSKSAKKGSETTKTTGSVTMKFSSYKINQYFADTVFSEKD